MQKTRNTHVVVPVPLAFPDGKASDVAQALDQLLKALGERIEHEGKVFALAAFTTAAQAEATIRQEGDQILVEKVPEFCNADNYVWVSATSLNDSTRPTMLLREIVCSEDVVLPLLEECESPAFSDQLAAFNNLVTSHTGSPLRDVFTELVLHDLKEGLKDELSSLPYTETIDLSKRGGYVDSPFDIDPVEAALSDPFALTNAAYEQSDDNICESEGWIVNSAIQEFWTNSAAEDLMPMLSALGHQDCDIEESLREWCQECTSHTGVVTLELQGDCAITARPMLGKEGIYITFDGVTSSTYNAVVDADYLAMLDLLNLDVRGWVDHLAERAGMVKPNWNIDLKAIVDGHLKDARFDPATGYHWDNQEAVRESLMNALFNLPTAQSTEISTAEIDALQIARSAYRDAIKNNAPEAEQEALKKTLDEAMQATRTPEEDDHEETAKYLFDIALQSLIADAEALDSTWISNNGVDPEALRAITSSSEQLKAFPQLIQAPDYFMALANLGSNGSTSYDWKNPPNASPVPAPLITRGNLTSILDNCNYSGNLVIAFSCSLDDLQKIGLAAQDAQVKDIRIDGAYLHIHDYINGAGDGEPLAGVWTVTTEQLKNKEFTLRNDTGNSYGIQGVFGQFLADNCGIVIAEPTQPTHVKRLEEDAPTIA